MNVNKMNKMNKRDVYAPPLPLLNVDNPPNDLV